MQRALRIAHLYPDHMNIYGDRGNIIALTQRCRWRGIAVEVVGVQPGAAVAWASFDLVFFGGGQDSGQALIAADFVQRHGTELCAAIADGLPMLAICGGYQLLGHYFQTHTGERLAGIGAIDAHTIGGDRRMIGDIAITIDGDVLGGGEPLVAVGFENHSGQTYLGDGVRPLGRVIAGHGNNGSDGGEGAVVHHAYGCYLHGSLLPKNPRFADHLLSLALVHAGGDGALAPLDDHREDAARAVMLERLQPPERPARRWWPIRRS
jgi:CobQ-like glutamine amidotransferase family enzyme